LKPGPRTPAVQQRARGKPHLIVGWREWLVLPELGIDSIKAKVDTGARTSALHAFDIEIVRKGEERWVKFKVHPWQRDIHRVVETRAPLIEQRLVRNSSGLEERRPVVGTVVEIMGHRWPIELTLTRRDVMGFRMLLGREAVRGYALVDPGGSFLTGIPPRERRKGKRARKLPVKGEHG
jgi:hypothetical protein